MTTLLRVVRGTPNTHSFGVYIGEQLPSSPLLTFRSPWHDLPLLWNNKSNNSNNNNLLYTYVNEIPRHSSGKYEIAADRGPFHPIVQDQKHGALRFLRRPMPFNYGCLPRTWEDPKHVFEATGLPGDNDPLDVVHLGERPLAIGEIRCVRVVGALALIDEGETDWKLLAFDHDVDDQREASHEQVSMVREWFRTYKGYPYNKYALGERLVDAKPVIDTAHQLFINMKKKQK